MEVSTRLAEDNDGVDPHLLSSRHTAALDLALPLPEAYTHTSDSDEVGVPRCYRDEVVKWDKAFPPIVLSLLTVSRSILRAMCGIGRDYISRRFPEPQSLISCW
jgi:hypothetical protein